MQQIQMKRIHTIDENEMQYKKKREKKNKFNETIWAKSTPAKTACCW